MSDPFALFSQSVAGWFRQVFGTPTRPQTLGWPIIARGDHALILSPTGSGKTLAAFLWGLNSLFSDLAATPEPTRGTRTPGAYRPGVRVVYVSPLKALNNDVERNLRVPLAGIQAWARQSGVELPDIRVAVRTGDTPSRDRQKMLRQPPHILITTPESLYLMLTAERAQAMFATTHTVIIDEIHTLVGSKRGAHLAVTLERLDRLSNERLQRIGLSATVRPLENAARFLGGQDSTADFAPRPVTIVDAGSRKEIDLRVITATDDFRNLPGDSTWPAIIPQVSCLIDKHRTTLIFCNSRRQAERTADRLNEYRLLQRQGAVEMPGPSTARHDLGLFTAGVDAIALEAAGLQPIRAHHGSMSKAARLDMESALKAGTLPALVCTSSLELGIDIGDIDLVVHLQSPKSVAAGLQRIGRSGHLVGQTPMGRVFTTHVEDVMEAAAVARGILRGDIEESHTPENPLDVLAQHIVAMVSTQPWDYAELFAVARGAYPFRHLGEDAFRGVLEMLAGKYPESVSRYLKARLSWDRINDRVTALPSSRLLAIKSGGTIPDRGTYTLVMSDRRTRVGELDEEFVFESRPGDTFLLGSQVWRVTEITDDRVIAEPAPGEVPRMPFWRGDVPWRPYDLGRRIGAFRRELAELLSVLAPGDVEHVLTLSERDLAELTDPAIRRLLAFLRDECALDHNSLLQVVEYAMGQVSAVGQIATDRAIIVEVFADAVGDPRMVVHSPFGGRVNGPWAIVLANAIRERFGVEAQISSGDDGILLRFASADLEPPSDLVAKLTSAEAKERLLAELPSSPVFGAHFRMNAARALLLPRVGAGKRTPLWLSRLRAKDLLQAVQQFDDFPILLETYRDCLRDVMDLAGLVDVLDQIQRGEIQVIVQESEFPSPVALSLDYRFAMQYVYEFDAPRGERQLAALSINRELLADLLRDGSLAELLKPEAVDDVAGRVTRTNADARARGVEELAQVLYQLGDLSVEEIAARTASSEYPEWIAQLAAAGRIYERDVGGARRWVHAERRTDYDQLCSNPLPIIRRRLMHVGPARLVDLAARYGLAEDVVEESLRELGRDAVVGQFVPGAGEQWIDRRNLEQIHRRTLHLLRREVQSVSTFVYAEFLRRWQRVGVEAIPAPVNNQPEPPDLGLTRVLQQLRGLAIPAVAWERDVLPSRLSNFDPLLLARMCQTGDLLWVAEGGRDARRARACFFFRGEGGIFLDYQPDESRLAALTDQPREVYEYLIAEGAALLPDIADGTGLNRSDAQRALVELVLAGLATNDTMAGLHAVLGYTPPPAARVETVSTLAAQLAELLPNRPRHPTRHRMREARRRARETVFARGRSGGADWVGRWSRVHRPGLLGRRLSDDERALRQARQLLTRWGVVTRACLERESGAIDWESVYPALALLEMRGDVRRGYFVSGLPGVQFALPEVVEQLRAIGGERRSGPPIVLSAVDPAQLFGSESFGSVLRFQRVASSAVALHGGEPIVVMENSGASVSFVPDYAEVIPSLRALARWWSARAGGRLRVERWQGERVLDSPGAAILEASGFVRDYDAMAWPG